MCGIRADAAYMRRPRHVLGGRRICAASAEVRRPPHICSGRRIYAADAAYMQWSGKFITFRASARLGHNLDVEVSLVFKRAVDGSDVNPQSTCLISVWR